MEIIKGIQKGPILINIFGVAGAGKSTLAAFSKNPVFIDVEGGIDRIDAEKTRKIQSKDQLIEALKWSATSSYDTVVIDTLSAVEEILAKDILEGTKYNSLADFPYGQGFEVLKSKWSAFMGFLFLLKERGKSVVTIAHEAIETINNPLGENYDRYTLAIHKKSVPIVVGKMDAVLYYHYEKLTKQLDDSKKIIAKDTGRRILATNEKAGYIAKNRFNLPEKIEITDKQSMIQLFNLLQGENNV